MSRHAIVLFILMVAGPAAGFALQDDSDRGIELDDLSAPSSPAFNVLGISPVDIERPSNLQAISTHVLNNIEEGGNFISDFALDFTPYWFKTHPDLTFEQYYGLDSKGNPIGSKVMENIAQTTSISFAATGFSRGDDSLDTRKLGLGMRTTLIRGKVSSKLDSLMLEYKMQDIQRNIAADLQEELEDHPDPDDGEIDAAVKAAISNYIFDLDDIKGFESNAQKERLLEFITRRFTRMMKAADAEEQLKAAQTGNISGILRQIRDLDKNRVGWIVEVAGGTSFRVPGNRTQDLVGDRYGIWSTITYRTDNSKADFILLTRFLGSFQDQMSTDFDLGLRLVRNYQSFNISVEGILRFHETEFETLDINNQPITAIERDESLRYILNAQYKISDRFNLTATIGKDFDSDTQFEGNFLTLIGLNLNLFKQQFITP